MATPGEVLAQIPLDGLKVLYAQDNPLESVENLKGRVATKAIASYIEETGTKVILSLLKRPVLQALFDNHFGSESLPIPNQKTVLTKRLSEAISRQGFSGFISDTSSDVRRDIANLLELENEDDELEDGINEEVQFLGMEAYFESFDISILKDVCFEMGLAHEHAQSKAVLIDAIIENQDVPEPTRRTASVFSDTKRPIKKGIRYEDIFQHYSVAELQEWARGEGIIASGKKKVLIERILMHLDGDQSVLSSNGPARGRPKKGQHKRSLSRENTMEATAREAKKFLSKSRKRES